METRKEARNAGTTHERGLRAELARLEEARRAALEATKKVWWKGQSVVLAHHLPESIHHLDRQIARILNRLARRSPS